MTQQQAKIDRAKSAVLIMDFQNDIVNGYAGDPKGVVERAATVLQAARRVGIPVIYVQHRGGPFEKDTPGSQIHAGVAPNAGEKVIAKTQTGAFSSTGLDVLLRERGIDTLILMGVATSGCVLSTSKWASDVAYKVIIVADGCSDRDPEVHRVLTEKIFGGSSITAQQLVRAVGTVK